MLSFKKILPLLLIALAFLKCKSEEANDNLTNDSSAVQLVSDFYNWYVNGVYKVRPGYYQSPPVKKLSPSTYIFNSERYRERLDEVKFFSTDFKNTLAEKLEICNTEMKKKKWDSEPESQFDIRDCDYLWYDNWVGGQGENIDGFKIVDKTSTNGLTEVAVQITIGDKPFSNVIVLVAKEGNDFKIFDIKLN